jgi:hypothetical protein
MTVETTTRKESFAGGQSSLTYTFRSLVDHPEYIKVLTVTSGTEALLVFNTDYTVAPSADGVGGIVTVSPSFGTEYTYTVYRDTADTQGTDYDDYNQFPSDTLEEDLDRRSCVEQEQAEDLDRAVTAPISSTLSTLALPAPVAGLAIGWNDDADGLVNLTVTGLPTGTSGQWIEHDGTTWDAVSALTNLAVTGPSTFVYAGGTASTIEIDADGTGHGIYLHQDGVLASSKHAFYIYSNAAQTNAALGRFYQDNASSSSDLLSVDNDGQGTCISIVQNGVNAQDKNAIRVISDAIHVNSPLVHFHQDHASADQNVLDIRNDGTGDGLFVDSQGGGHGIYVRTDTTVLTTQKHTLYVTSDQANIAADAAIAKFQSTSASNTQPVVEIDNDGAGHGLYIHQDTALGSSSYALFVEGTVANTTSELVRFTQADDSDEYVLNCVHSGESADDYRVFSAYNSQCSFRMAHWNIDNAETIAVETIFTPGGNYGILEIWVGTGDYGRFLIKGGSNSVTLIDDPFTNFAASDTASKYCVIADGDGTYSIKNNRATGVFSIILKGFS